MAVRPFAADRYLSIDGLLQKVERKSDLERWDARHRNEREPGSVLVYVTRLSEFRNEADRSLNHFFYQMWARLVASNHIPSPS